MDTSKINIPLVVLIAFLGGLFLLAFGAGLWLFRMPKQPEVEVLSAATTNATASKIVVQVDGAVAKPGVYELALGARVNDAVGAAGGLTTEADSTRLNLAAKVADGQKVTIPRVGEVVTGTTSSTSTMSNTGLININIGTAAELDKLPGIGPVTADKIIASRPYSSPEELLSKKVVSSSVYEKIKDLISY